jgi:hypothetical protein
MPDPGLRIVGGVGYREVNIAAGQKMAGGTASSLSLPPTSQRRASLGVPRAANDIQGRQYAASDQRRAPAEAVAQSRSARPPVLRILAAVRDRSMYAFTGLLPTVSKSEKVAGRVSVQCTDSIAIHHRPPSHSAQFPIMQCTKGDGAGVLSPDNTTRQLDVAHFGTVDGLWEEGRSARLSGKRHLAPTLPDGEPHARITGQLR